MQSKSTSEYIYSLDVRMGKMSDYIYSLDIRRGKMQLQLYSLRHGRYYAKVLAVKVIRETALSWYVGKRVACGGYIRKNTKKWFTDIREAFKILQPHIKANIKLLQGHLLHQQMAHDLIEEEDWTKLEAGGMIDVLS